jgi:hypothetical protein
LRRGGRDLRSLGSDGAQNSPGLSQGLRNGRGGRGEPGDPLAVDEDRDVGREGVGWGCRGRDDGRCHVWRAGNLMGSDSGAEVGGHAQRNETRVRGVAPKKATRVALPLPGGRCNRFLTPHRAELSSTSKGIDDDAAELGSTQAKESEMV